MGTRFEKNAELCGREGAAASSSGQLGRHPAFPMNFRTCMTEPMQTSLGRAMLASERSMCAKCQAGVSKRHFRMPTNLHNARSRKRKALKLSFSGKPQNIGIRSHSQQMLCCVRSSDLHRDTVPARRRRKAKSMIEILLHRKPQTQSIKP